MGLLGPGVWAYTRSRDFGGFLRRPDFTNVRFLVNERTAAGLTNTTGMPIITANSDPMPALRAAAETWTAVPSSSVAFAALGLTALDSPAPDGVNIVTFADTPANSSLVGDALAVTRTFLGGPGEIADTDIVFGANVTFSTTLQTGTFDVQSVAVHELGHALGAGHSGLVGASMFFSGQSASKLQGLLTSDDIAFVTEAYPEPGAAGLAFGAISGVVNLNTGGGVRGALVTAIDPATGVAVGTITAVDGSYTIGRIPPGRYYVYAEPMDGPVQGSQLGAAGNGANTVFSTAILGGFGTPTPVAVAAGGAATATLTVDTGDPELNIQGAGVGAPGTSLTLRGGPVGLRPGETVDFAAFGTGLDDLGITDKTITFLGAPITVQPGSLRRGRTSNDRPSIRVLVQVAATASPGVATLVIRSATAASVYSAGVRILPPSPVFSAAGVVSAASYTGGSAAPGEIISIFGVGLGPSVGVQGGLDTAGRLSTAVGDVTVAFNGVRAPLFFVSATQINAQAPLELAGQSSAAVVVSYQGNSSPPATVGITRARPGIFQLAGSSQGVILNQDGSLNGSANPAARGQVVVIFATGQGMLDPPLATGVRAPASPLSSASAVTATFGGAPGRVLFGVMTPGFVGLMQVNAELPADAPTGASVPVSISVAGAASQANVTMAVQ